MRNATAYGFSPRLRADIVVNNLVGYAHTVGEIRMQSDGTAWRPLVHIRDISRAAIAALEAPRELVHNEAFNVGARLGELPYPRGRRDRRRGDARDEGRVRQREWTRQALLPGRLFEARARPAGCRAAVDGPPRCGGARGMLTRATT